MAAFTVGCTIEGEVVSFTSHGAMVDIPMPGGGAMHCYIPLTAMGTPPRPRRARCSRRVRCARSCWRGWTRPRRVAELALPAPETAPKKHTADKKTAPAKRAPTAKVAPPAKKAAAKKAAAPAKKAAKKAVATAKKAPKKAAAKKVAKGKQAPAKKSTAKKAPAKNAPVKKASRARPR